MNDETIKQKGLFGKLRSSLSRTRTRLFGETEDDLPADDAFGLLWKTISLLQIWERMQLPIFTQSSKSGH